MCLRLLVLALALGVTVLPAHAAQEGAASGPRGAKPGGARAVDPLANLEIYEQRRYRIEMQDCYKQTGAERKVCQRSVRNKAAAKSRRRGASRQ